MIEVEIRAKIEDINLIRGKILSLGAKYIKTEEQTDKIFGRPEDLDENHKIIEGHFSARIRQKADKILVEFKEIRRTGAGLEFSSSVHRIEDGVYLLEKLGYEEAFTVSKTRDLYKLREFEICLDQVDKLGNYIEIEHSAKDGDQKEKAIKECEDLLFEIDQKTIVEPKKYGDLMQELINQNEVKTKDKKVGV